MRLAPALGLAPPGYHDRSRVVSIAPGETTLTVMPWPANSDARPRANPERPILGADTWARVADPANAPVAAYEDDASAAVLQHGRQHGLGAEEGALEHHAHHAPPVLVGDLQKRLVRAYGSVAHQHVDAAELVERPRRHRVNPAPLSATSASTPMAPTPSARASAATESASAWLVRALTTTFAPSAAP